MDCKQQHLWKGHRRRIENRRKDNLKILSSYSYSNNKYSCDSADLKKSVFVRFITDERVSTNFFQINGYPIIIY